MRCLHNVMIVAVLLLLAGCGGKQPSLHYYQLTSTALPVTSESEKLPELTLAVGPVSVPEMLKRQELVIRGEGNQYQLTSLHRWAGLLEKDLTAAIFENLGKQLGSQKVTGFPWGTYYNPEYRVIIEVLSLTGRPGEMVELRAGWTIIDHLEKQLLVRKISEYQQPLTDPSIDSLVEGESQVVALLCQDISDSLRQFAKQ